MHSRPVDSDRRMDGTKLRWHWDRVTDYFDKGVRVPPINLDIGTTKRCNAKCVYCYGRYQGKDRSSVDRGKLIGLFKDAAKAGVKSISVIGDGEPLINPAIYEALRVGSNNGLSLALSTNGVLLNSKELQHHVCMSCEWMRFNLGAVERKKYREIHGSDAWRTVEKNIRETVKTRNLVPWKCEIGLQVVFIPELMWDTVGDICQFGIDAGVDYVVIKQCSLPDSGQSGMLQFNLDLYDDPTVVDALEKAEAMSTPRTQVVVKWNTMGRKGERHFDHCLGVPFLVEMSGNGKFYPCGYLFGDPMYEMGDIHQAPIGEIIQSDRYWEVVRMMAEQFDPHIMCKGECRPVAINEECWQYTHPPKGVNFV